ANPCKQLFAKWHIVVTLDVLKCARLIEKHPRRAKVIAYQPINRSGSSGISLDLHHLTVVIAGYTRNVYANLGRVQWCEGEFSPDLIIAGDASSRHCGPGAARPVLHLEIHERITRDHRECWLDWTAIVLLQAVNIDLADALRAGKLHLNPIGVTKTRVIGPPASRPDMIAIDRVACRSPGVEGRRSRDCPIRSRRQIAGRVSFNLNHLAVVIAGYIRNVYANLGRVQWCEGKFSPDLIIAGDASSRHCGPGAARPVLHLEIRERITRDHRECRLDGTAPVLLQAVHIDLADALRAGKLHLDPIGVTKTRVIGPPASCPDMIAIERVACRSPGVQGRRSRHRPSAGGRNVNTCCRYAWFCCDQ